MNRLGVDNRCLDDGSLAPLGSSTLKTSSAAVKKQLGAASGKIDGMLAHRPGMGSELKFVASHSETWKLPD